MWLPHRKTNNWHNILNETNTWEIKRAGKPLNIVYVSLIKAFDTVSRIWVYDILKKIECPSQIVSHLLKPSKRTCREQIMMDLPPNHFSSQMEWVKQGCVSAAFLFCIFFSMLPWFAFHLGTSGIYDVCRWRSTDSTQLRYHTNMVYTNIFRYVKIRHRYDNISKHSVKNDSLLH